MESVEPGVVVPMPTLPVADIRIFSVPPLAVPILNTRGFTAAPLYETEPILMSDAPAARWRQSTGLLLYMTSVSQMSFHANP
jgi:hypothetical protein